MTHFSGWVEAAAKQWAEGKEPQSRLFEVKNQQKTGVVYSCEFGNSILGRIPTIPLGAPVAATVTTKADRGMLCDKSLSHAIRRPGTLSATWQNWLWIDIVFWVAIGRLGRHWITGHSMT